MHCSYDDIRERIQEPPKWFDEFAVPRYCEFSPKKVANIHAREVVLVLIRCQHCEKKFEVSFTELNLIDELWDRSTRKKLKNISDLIEDGTLRYGDPPNVGCCGSGPTMNSVAIRVLEYWYRPIVRGEGVSSTGTVTDRDALELKRDAGLEREISRNRPAI